MTALHISELQHRYGRNEVLRGVELVLHPGELVGLVGPNGAGKSTLLRCIVGAEAIQHGAIQVAGFDIARASFQARACLGVAVEPERLPNLLTARQCQELVADIRHERAALPASFELCGALGLAPWLDRPVHEYSLGTRQKLAIVLALIGTPRLVILDEVLNGLDPLSAYALKEALRRRTQQGACVLLATHGLEVAERFLDRAALLLDGRIAADWDATALAKLRADPDGGLEHAVVAMLRERAGASDRAHVTPDDGA